MTTYTCNCGTVHVVPLMATPEAIAESERHDRENRHKRAVVAAIREQRPGLIPDTLGECTEGWFGGLGRLGIPALESFLWREYTAAGLIGWHVGKSIGSWQAVNRINPDLDRSFGDEALSLVRALCHSLHISLPAEGGAS